MGTFANKIITRDRKRSRPEKAEASSDNRIEVNPAWIVRALFRITALLVVLNLLAIFTWLEGGYEQALGLVPGFNMDKEANIPTFFSGLILLTAGGLFGLIAWYKKKYLEPNVLHWALLAGVFICMALDEVASFHEHLILPLRNSLNLSGIFYYSWVLVGMAFLLAFAALYLKFFFSLPARFRWGFFLAGCVYVAGALGMELIGGFFAEQDGLINLRYALITTVEETMELIGIILLIKFLLIYLQEQTDIHALSLVLKK
ncbi:hypothetical protein [Nafulsella turpanensis]|uniref:hypothetical protein n=1 Tax=Nafulsella turpanensis TaxID=1265690 RepID=UPI00035DBD09|nr:hypothetical protein [Nafulsella turpanensis]